MQQFDNLILGFDASCARCSGLAEKIRADANGALEVEPLGSLRMRAWREQALGADAPWAPTLVREVGDDVEAWTGWSIAPVLVGHLGTKRAWSILGTLGSDHLDRTRRRGPRRMSRATFLRGVVGAAAAVTVLGGRRPAMAESPAGDPERPTPEAEELALDDADAMSVVRRHLESADVANTADVASLGMAAGGAATMAEVPDANLRLFRSFDEAETLELDASNGTEPLAVTAEQRRHPDGAIEEKVLVYQRGEGVMVFSERLEHPDGEVETSAMRLDIHDDVPETSDEPIAQTVARSFNGGVPDLVDSNQLATTTQGDPCGPCGYNPPGAPSEFKGHFTRSCNLSATWSCISSVGGCAFCLPCSAVWACVGCAIFSCTSIFNHCCAGTSEACIHCPTVPR